MKSSRLVLVLAGLACLIVFVPSVHSEAPAGGGAVVPAQVLVQFRTGVSDAQAQAVINAHQGRSMRQIPQIRVHVVSLPAAGNEAAYAQAFRNRPEVQSVEVDRLVPHALTPNDPQYSSEWHLTRISAPTAWDTTTGSTSIVIAILDTGVDGAHEDLAPKMVAGWNIWDNNSDTRDVYGHGTKVAGTAAAASNNGIGVASVAWNCRIMPVRVSATTGSATYSSIASGLTWAADHGARVANISYMVTTSSTVTSAAQYFQSRGGVVASSAGNNAAFDASADNPYILTVSGSDPSDVLYSWSNTGNNVDLAAPGCILAPANGGGYASGCGTSFSSPIVAGVAALVLSVKPALSPSDVTRILQQSADDVGAPGWDPSFGWGRVNAARAVSQAGAGGGTDTQPPSVAFVTPAGGATVSGTVSVQVSASDNVGVTSVTVTLDGGATLCAFTATPYTCTWDTTKTTNGAHTLTAAAKDAAGNSSSASVTVTVNNLRDSTPPTVNITSPAPGSTVSGVVSVYVTTWDNVGVVKVQLFVDGALAATSTTAPFTTRWNARKAAPGAHVLTAIAYDAAGNAGASQPVTVYR